MSSRPASIPSPLHPLCRSQALKTRINEVADRLFAQFSKRVGVASIREWEEQHAAFEQGVATRRAELQQQVGRHHILEAQLVWFPLFPYPSINLPH